MASLDGLGMGHSITIIFQFLPWKNHIWFLYHSWNIVHKFGLFLVQFWLYDVTRIAKFPNFWMTEDQIFHLKKNIYGSKFRTFGHCLVAIYCFEPAVKNLGEWRQRAASVSHLLFLLPFKFLLLTYDLSNFVPIFKKELYLLQFW